jgi:hypothetical protein
MVLNLYPTIVSTSMVSEVEGVLPIRWVVLDFSSMVTVASFSVLKTVWISSPPTDFTLVTATLPDGFSWGVGV